MSTAPFIGSPVVIGGPTAEAVYAKQKHQRVVYWVVGLAVAIILGAIALVAYQNNKDKGGGGGGGSGANPLAAFTLLPDQQINCPPRTSCDIVSGGKNVAAMADCAALCNGDSRCNAFLYLRSGALGGSNCWVKVIPDAATATPTSLTGWTMGYKA
jgi:hypothetical protein